MRRFVSYFAVIALGLAACSGGATEADEPDPIAVEEPEPDDEPVEPLRIQDFALRQSGIGEGEPMSVQGFHSIMEAARGSESTDDERTRAALRTCDLLDEHGTLEDAVPAIREEVGDTFVPEDALSWIVTTGVSAYCHEHSRTVLSYSLDNN